MHLKSIDLDLRSLNAVNHLIRVAEQSGQRTDIELRDDPELQALKAVALDVPGRILHSGLAQSLGYLMAKRGNHDEYWRYGNILAGLVVFAGDLERFHSAVVEADRPQYERLSRQAIAASSAFKKYSQALIPTPGDRSHG